MPPDHQLLRSSPASAENREQTAASTEEDMTVDQDGDVATDGDQLQFFPPGKTGRDAALHFKATGGIKRDRLKGPYRNCFHSKTGYIKAKVAFEIMAAKDSRGEYILPESWYTSWGRTFWEAGPKQSWARFVAEKEDPLLNARGQIRQRAPSKIKASRDASGQFTAPADISMLSGSGTVSHLDHPSGAIDQDLKHFPDIERAIAAGLAEMAAAKVKVGKQDEQSRKVLNEARKAANRIIDIEAQMKSDNEHIMLAKAGMEALSTCYNNAMESRSFWMQEALRLSMELGQPLSQDDESNDVGHGLPASAKDIFDLQAVLPEAELPSMVAAAKTRARSQAKVARRLARMSRSDDTIGERAGEE